MKLPSRIILFAALVGCGKDEPARAPQLVEPAPAPSEPTLRRLTQHQYRNAIVDLLGEGLVLPTSLEPDTAVDGLLSIGSAVTSVSPLGVEQYEDAALDLAEQALTDASRRDELVGCTPSATVDDACAEAFLTTFARRAWRRPPSVEEVDLLVGIAAVAAGELEDFHGGLVYAVATVLQSPWFLYRQELGVPGAGGRLTPFELATRLSFLFWNTIPDEELLAAAESGALDDDADIEAQARRLLEDPRSSRGLRALASEWLELYALDDLSKDPTVFPHFTDALGPSAREETLLVIEDLVGRDADFRDLVTTRGTFIDRNLAMIYGVAAPAREGFAALTLSDRVGFLGQVSFLASHGHPVSTSATLRGKFVREALLCQEIPPPPADLNTSIPEPSPDAQTLRERVAVHLENAYCAGCHEMTDPIGLGVENFDGLGLWRTHENGAPIDPSGDLDDVPFADAAGLAWAVRAHPSFAVCISDTLFAWAVGHRPASTELATAEWLHASFAGSDHSLDALLVTLATSEAFRTVGEIQ